MRNAAKFVATFTFAMFIMGGTAQAAVIDLFTDGAVTLDTDGANPDTADQSGISDVIGSGDRNLIVTENGTPTLGDDLGVDLVLTGAGLSAMSSDSGLSGSWEFIYGADSPFDVDLTDGGNANQFAVNFTEADLGASLTITVEDTDSDVDSQSVAVTGPGLVSLYFADFSGDIDFTNAARLSFLLEGPTNGDYTISSIKTVPAPAALPAGLALLGLTILRRRRRAA